MESGLGSPCESQTATGGGSVVISEAKTAISDKHAVDAQCEGSSCRDAGIAEAGAENAAQQIGLMLVQSLRDAKLVSMFPSCTRHFHFFWVQYGLTVADINALQRKIQVQMQVYLLSAHFLPLTCTIPVPPHLVMPLRTR